MNNQQVNTIRFTRNTAILNRGGEIIVYRRDRGSDGGQNLNDSNTIFPENDVVQPDENDDSVIYVNTVVLERSEDDSVEYIDTTFIKKEDNGVIGGACNKESTSDAVVRNVSNCDGTKVAELVTADNRSVNTNDGAIGGKKGDEDSFAVVIPIETGLDVGMSHLVSLVAGMTVNSPKMVKYDPSVGIEEKTVDVVVNAVDKEANTNEIKEEVAANQSVDHDLGYKTEN
ncbi:uncharacterized protein LOC116340459 [Contarinia nasturtii]|uniref:uncharacterized protein LOC116340459 n=1 Tax=Contarinia nasturtii TaxID=265458 RepID=UPI0012D3CAE2|nr:uncharacterized protein LOC116340459 [Contarinia nasturtii]